MKTGIAALKVCIVLGCVVAFVLLVLWKQNVVRMNREKSIVSTISDWERNGKPVIVQKIEKKDMKVYTKITLTPLSKTLFEGYVPKSTQEKLKPGQQAFIEAKGGRAFGLIKDVEQVINVDTGMFRVRAKFNPVVDLVHRIVVAYVHTGTLKNVISVPNEIIENENGKYFLWVIQDGYVHKQNIVLGLRNGYRAVVIEGLHDGEMVVLEGYTQLFDKDKANIVGHHNAVMGDES